jgi:hemolysin III
MSPNPHHPRVKPRLRGVSHEIAAYVSIPAAIALVIGARGPTAVAAAATYGASVVLLFAASAIYHRPFWPPRARDIVGRIDHSAIFVLIAGTYTPFALLIGPGAGHALLAVIWTGALAGVALAIAWPRAPKRLMAAIYVLLGWTVVPVLPALLAAIGTGTLLLLLAGGLLYTVGAVVYALRRPDPIPAVFGYHEIFHLLVLGAAICHFIVAEAAIRALG